MSRKIGDSEWHQITFALSPLADGQWLLKTYFNGERGGDWTCPDIDIAFAFVMAEAARFAQLTLTEMSNERDS